MLLASVAGRGSREKFGAFWCLLVPSKRVKKHRKGKQRAERAEGME
jgi:hypothetical protein